MKHLFLLSILALTSFNAKGDKIAFPVTFSIKDPHAGQVQVAGEFNNWEKRLLIRDNQGTWSRTFYVEPGEYGYKFMVDQDQWIRDPLNPNKKDDNSLLVVDETGYEAPRAVRVTFGYTNGAAKAVHVTGTFNDWKDDGLSMQRDGDSWSVSLPLEPGDYEYKLVVDGEWIHDPGNPLRSTNFTGTENSLISIFGNSRSFQNRPRPIRLGDHAVFANTLHYFSLPLSAAEWERSNKFEKIAKKAKSSFPRGGMMDAALLLPPGFDPRKPWPILIVNGPDGWDSRAHMKQCFSIAAEAGYVVLAADGLGTCWARCASTLEYLHSKWPPSRRWPLAFAGFTGGGDLSFYMAACAVKAGRKVMGVFAGGSQNDLATINLKSYKPSPIKFRTMPIYLLNGTDHEHANAAVQERVKTSMIDNGFKKVASETYEGEQFPIPVSEVKDGLNWLRQQAGLMR